MGGENNFENGSDDIGKHRIRKQTRKRTVEIRKTDTQKSENQTDNIRNTTDRIRKQGGRK